jgi:hypothetical protein
VKKIVNLQYMWPRNTILTAQMSRRLLGVFILAGWTLCASASYFTGGNKGKDARKDATAMFPFSNLKNKNTLQLSLKAGLQFGLQFSGDYNNFSSQVPGSVVVHSLMTYQKGNTVFVFPYKQSLLLSKFKTPERILR